jgi:hypothetical protein
VPADADEVYDRLVDPSTYLRFPGVRHAELLRPGTNSTYGVGAVRRIHVSGFRFDEEIVAADPGTSFSYRVVASRPPLDHELGTVAIEPGLAGCTVTWTTTYRVPVPVIGRLLARLGGPRMRRAFDDAIRIAGSAPRAHAEPTAR